MPVILGTRNSELALIQAESVKTALELEGHDVEIKTFSSKGDSNRNIPLYRMSSTGVFVDELNERVVNGEIDIAVHSAKDIPSSMHDSLEISAVLKREDYRDLLISRTPLEKMTAEDKLGTSSIRRIRQVKTVNANVKISDIRGNIDTRIFKYMSGDYSGIIMAKAAYNRMKLDIEHFELSEDQFLPAPNQGIIAIVSRKGSSKSDIARSINDTKTYSDMENERYLVKKLNLGCSKPVGILCESGIIKTRFYSLKSDEYIDLNFKVLDMESITDKIREAIVGYGYF